MSEKISGKIDKIIFHNDLNGYTVMNTITFGEKLTVLCNLNSVMSGMEFEAEGEYINHAVYGKQFKSEYISLKDPEDKNAILLYLSSGMLPGIGEKKAVDIYDTFGEDTLRVLEEEPERLCEVKGIGAKTALIVGMSFRTQKESRNIMIELGKYGITSNYAMRLYKEYKGDTLDIIKKNPYTLIDDISGIGFKKADEIAKNTGIELDSRYRVVSGLKYCMAKNYQNGNTYITEDELLKQAQMTLGVDVEIIKYHLLNMVDAGSIVFEQTDEQRRYYLPFFYESEEQTAKRLIDIISTPSLFRQKDIDVLIQRYENSENIVLEKEQKEAIASSVSSKVSIITGGPGTGKTTIIKAVIYILKEIGLSFKLAAPTGRAAKRMSSACGDEAKTIHRLLEYSSNDDDSTMYFGKDEDNPIQADFIIIDEMSMVDIVLMGHLLNAVENKTSIIFVGDEDQLPSVGAGNVLSDMIECGVFNVKKLKRIFRQKETSSIIINSHKINNGQMPILDNSSNDFIFIDVLTQPKIANAVTLMIKNHKNNMLRGFDLLEDVQVITPLKKGEAGAAELNMKIQSILNPGNANKDEIRFANTTFRLGDKVMQVRNNYQLKWKNVKDLSEGRGVYNGDIGIITAINKNDNEKKVEVMYDNERKVLYRSDDLRDINLSYAITVHKSQGCEFPVVILPVFGGYYGFLTRNLLYTAVTRAKEKVIIIGEKRYLRMMVSNPQRQKRLCALSEKIEKYYYNRI